MKKASLLFVLAVTILASGAHAWECPLKNLRKGGQTRAPDNTAVVPKKEFVSNAGGAAIGTVYRGK